MIEEQIQPKEGYIIDFISGEQVKATPEEKEAVQVFAHQLVEDYGYKKEQIQTRPQYRVKVRPSDNEKSYPVDIMLFKNNEKKDGNEYIVVECKKKTRRDGLTQLHDYLRFCRAERDDTRTREQTFSRFRFLYLQRGKRG